MQLFCIVIFKWLTGCFHAVASVVNLFNVAMQLCLTGCFRVVAEVLGGFIECCYAFAKVF